LKLLVPHDDNLALALQDDFGLAPILLNAAGHPDFLAPVIVIRIWRKLAKIGGEDYGGEIRPPVRGEVQKADFPSILGLDDGAFDGFDLAVIVGSILPGDGVLADGGRGAYEQNRRDAKEEVTDTGQAPHIEDQGSHHRKAPEAFPLLPT
jgi:hypothetical protein